MLEIERIAEWSKDHQLACNTYPFQGIESARRFELKTDKEKNKNE